VFKMNDPAVQIPGYVLMVPFQFFHLGAQVRVYRLYVVSVLGIKTVIYHQLIFDIFWTFKLNAFLMLVRLGTLEFPVFQNGMDFLHEDGIALVELRHLI